MICKLCNKKFPVNIFINGKRKNLQNRKYCLNCSPYGQHNTRKLCVSTDGRVERENANDIKICINCKRPMRLKKERGFSCWVCTNKKSREKKLLKVQGIVGNSCWVCGYNKCWQALDFHHVLPEKKLFNLTAHELQYSWNRVYDEIQKCVLLCACCHREVHAGLIDKNNIMQIWEHNWSKNF